MSIQDESLATEAKWIIDICSSPRGKTLTKEREYELMRLAQPALKAQRILSKKANQMFLSRHPKTRAGLNRVAKAGDKAITELLERNYRLIINIAKKLQGRGLSWEDMIQHGSDGLLYAVLRFDLNSNNKLSTYATQWIRQRISRAIENTGRAIRIPIHMQAKINEIKYIYRKRLQDEQEKPNSEEIAYLYNLNPRNKKNFKPITKEEAEELGRYIQDIGSLDEPTGDDENLSVLSYIKDEGAGPENITERAMDKEYVASILCTLPSGDSAFIKFKFGLVDDTPKSDAKTAEAFQMTIKQVKENEVRILGELLKVAEMDKSNMERDREVYSIILISLNPSAAGVLSYQEASVLVRKPVKADDLPCKVYESTDRDQMLILRERLVSLGFRVEVISSF